MKKTLSLLLIAFSQICYSQQTIYLTGLNNKLYTFNPNNCSLTFVANSTAMADIAVTPNGNLWGYSGSKLWSINPINGQVTEIGWTNPTQGGVSLVALNNTTLLFVSGGFLYAMNTSTVSVTAIGPVPYNAAGDLTWYDNNLFMPSTEGLLIKIVLNNTNTNVVSVTPVNNLSNPIPICEAMITANFEGFDNALIGFSQSEAYKICPIDGSYEPLCSGLITQFPGADSMRLPNQINTPTTCEQILSISETAYSSYYIVTNPIKQNGLLQIHLNQTTNNQVVKIDIFDMQGHFLLTKKENPNSETISLNITNYALSRGMYIVRISSNSKSKYLKLIVETRLPLTAVNRARAKRTERR